MVEDRAGFAPIPVRRLQGRNGGQIAYSPVAVAATITGERQRFGSSSLEPLMASNREVAALINRIGFFKLGAFPSGARWSNVYTISLAGQSVVVEIVVRDVMGGKRGSHTERVAPLRYLFAIDHDPTMGAALSGRYNPLAEVAATIYHELLHLLTLIAEDCGLAGQSDVSDSFQKRRELAQRMMAQSHSLTNYLFVEPAKVVVGQGAARGSAIGAQEREARRRLAVDRVANFGLYFSVQEIFAEVVSRRRFPEIAPHSESTWGEKYSEELMRAMVAAYREASDGKVTPQLLLGKFPQAASKLDELKSLLVRI